MGLAAKTSQLAEGFRSSGQGDWSSEVCSSDLVTALEPETGRLVWKYSSPRRIHGRGLAYWKGTNTIGPRLFFATDKGYLMGLDIKTGKLAEGFGKSGEVDV